MDQNFKLQAPPPADSSDPTASAALATRGSRLLAQFIDALILVIPAMLIGTVAAFLFPALQVARDGPPSGLGLFVLQLVVGNALFLALNFSLLARQGQTIGKRVAGVRIVRPDGSLAGIERLLLRRYLPVALLGAIPLVNLLIVIDALCIFRGSRRCIHDELADTLVVKA